MKPCLKLPPDELIPFQIKYVYQFNYLNNSLPY